MPSRPTGPPTEPPAEPPSKAALVAALRRRLEERLAVLRAEQAAARAGTRVDPGHRPTNRGERAAVTAQGYLAEALGRRMDALLDALRLLGEVPLEPRDRAGAGALATLRTEDDEILHVCVLPGAQADRFDAFPGVLVVSPRSPLGRALAGLEPGDPVTIRRGGREVEAEVEAVR